jgi:hypothetical protein
MMFFHAKIIIIMLYVFLKKRERLSIKLEPDKTVANQSHLRRGVVKFDNYELSAKLVRSPTTTFCFKFVNSAT